MNINDLKTYEGEIWKEHAIGVYVSNRGKCYVTQSGKHLGHYTYGSKRGDGYLGIKKDGIHYSVHRLVAECFLENPNNLPIINHKDENPSNNNVSNLEWCSYQYNANYGTAQERIINKLSKPINQYSKDGELIKNWQSARQVERELGYNQGHICECCKGKRKSCGSFIWKYAS